MCTAPSPFPRGPCGTCLVGGILVDDTDVLAVREPQEAEVLGSLQVVFKVIEDLQQPEKWGLAGECPLTVEQGSWEQGLETPQRTCRGMLVKVQGVCLQSLTKLWSRRSVQPSQAPRG